MRRTAISAYVAAALILIAGLAAFTVACAGGNPGPTSFATGSGVINGRVAVDTSTVFCVDRPSGTRTCFHYGMDAEVPVGLKIGDDVAVVAINGLVDRVMLSTAG